MRNTYSKFKLKSKLQLYITILITLFTFQILITNSVLYAQAGNDYSLGCFITLRGEIICSDTGRAPEKTKITVYDANTISSPIKEIVVYGGTYELNLDPGEYRVYFSSDGYQTSFTDKIIISRQSVYVYDVALTGADFDVQGNLHITVVDESGYAVPYADVLICHMSSRSHKSYADVTNESVDPCGFLMKARTDNRGRLNCYLEPKNNALDYNGCYVLMVDKDNVRGASDNIGRMVWPNCYFVEGIEAGAEIAKEIILEPYLKHPNNQHIIFQVSEGDVPDNVSGCTIRLYEGWNVTNFSSPSYVAVQNPESVYRWEQIEFDVPLGRYTAEIERLGMKKHMEILVTPNCRIFHAVVGKDDNVVNH